MCIHSENVRGCILVSYFLLLFTLEMNCNDYPPLQNCAKISTGIF